MALTKAQILAKKDLVVSEIEVPEWEGTVRVSTMMGYARDRFEALITKANGSTDNDNIRAKLVAACIVDDKGELMFNENDIETLGKKSCKALDRIFAEAKRINGLGATEVDDLAKN